MVRYLTWFGARGGTSKTIRALSLFALTLLAGCGTYVPEIEEFWGARSEPGVRGDATFIVNKIAGQVACELARAVQQVYQDPPPVLAQKPGEPPEPDESPPPKPRDMSWFESWSVQATLTLTILEQSTLSAGITANNVLNNATTTFGKTVITTAQSSALGFGVGGSTAATRTDWACSFR
jgi:hypothetical protein